jgi:hypothetical protein
MTYAVAPAGGAAASVAWRGYVGRRLGRSRVARRGSFLGWSLILPEFSTDGMHRSVNRVKGGDKIQQPTVDHGVRERQRNVACGLS